MQFILRPYHAERNHQELDNELIEPGETTGSESGTIDCRERLGGMLTYYNRRAAGTTTYERQSRGGKIFIRTPTPRPK